MLRNALQVIVLRSNSVSVCVQDDGVPKLLLPLCCLKCINKTHTDVRDRDSIDSMTDNFGVFFILLCFVQVQHCLARQWLFCIWSKLKWWVQQKILCMIQSRSSIQEKDYADKAVQPSSCHYGLGEHSIYRATPRTLSRSHLSLARLKHLWDLGLW